MIGKTLTHYEVTSLLGKGGMGEVWQATDTKLGRAVAIKTLPAEFAQDEERLARFEREAKLLASLNHPNIAGIYGLEQDGDTRFLVLELVEGDTLAERIRRGPIPVEEALDIARQTVEALEAAHEKGIIHRDLKPANIKVTPEGKVKVLDFGLAKAFAGDEADANTSNSPTLSMAATGQGVILGTAAYMSPEQAKGIPVDRRGDIFSFGCVLFEMLTGRRAFQGELATEVLASIITREPDYTMLQANLHPKIKEVLRRCFEKEPKNRWQAIGDVRVEIAQVLSGPGGALVEPVEVGAETKPRSLLPWVAATFTITAMVVGIAVWAAMRPAPPVITRLTVGAPTGVEIILPTLSPDGRLLAFMGVRDGQTQIYTRHLDQLEALPLRGSEGARSIPTFSPDGRQIAFNPGGILRKVQLAGGPAVTLAEAPNWGQDWGPDDTIVFRRSGGGLSIVPAVGGASREITTPARDEGESRYQDPQFLPDGRGILFVIVSTGSSAKRVAVLSLDTGERRILVEGNTPRFAPTGHLLFARDGAVWAVPFDTDRLQIQGEPVPMLEGVEVNENGFARYNVSLDGSLVYRTGTSGGVQRTLLWVDRNGGEEPIEMPAGNYFDPRLSPDGTRVALALEDEGNMDIWIWDLVRETRTRLTFDQAIDRYPIWTPDAQRVAFFSTRDGNQDVYWKAADGTGQVERLSAVPDRRLIPRSWSADANSLLLSELALSGTTSYDIGILSMEGDRPWRPLIQGEFVEVGPAISPDGRWMAYISNESGRQEIYVRPFPDVEAGRWQVSTSGGGEPKWSADGRTLFYRFGRTINRVSVETEEAFEAGIPETLYEGTFFNEVGPQWDVDPNGERFLVIRNVESTGEEIPQELRIVLNWFEELKEKVPVP